MSRSGPLRIAVTGPECSGKTTLAQALASRFHAPFVEEYGHAYFEKKIARGDHNVYASDVVAVITEQSRREDAVAFASTRLIVCDTDAFTIACWHDLFTGSRQVDIEHLAQIRQAFGKGIDLYILCAPDFPFVPDPVRTGEFREARYEVFRERLTDAGDTFIEVSGAPEPRLATAVSHVQRLLDGRL